MRSIKRQYILTCAKITGISVTALLVMSISSAILYWHSSDITNKQLPYTLELNVLSESVTASLDSLNSWVLLGDKKHKQKRKMIWHDRIFPSLKIINTNIEQSEDIQQIKKLDQLNDKLNALYTSQWWVEDVTQFIGNQPSLVIYQRDLLPIYYRIQSALSGVAEANDNPSAENELRLTISNTHLLLSETIHQISEIILTGEIAHLSRFKQGAEKVAVHIQILKNQQQLNADAALLVDWIDRHYGIYINLANKVTEIRQASDWNQAIYIIDTETEGITNEVKQLLLEIQRSHIQKLENDMKWAESATFLAFILALALLFLTMTAAIFLVGGNARRMVKQIVELEMAAKELAQGRQNTIDIVYDDELGALAKVFNQMQKIIIRRRKKFVRERERLSEVVRIITHDIKSPLININGHSEMIYSQVMQSVDSPQTLNERVPEIESSLKYVKLSIRRIDELIGGILEFSSVVHKKIKLDNMQFRSSIDELLELNSSRLTGAQVNISNIPKELICDAFAFKFIFSTLLDNAIKYQSSERSLVLDIDFQLNLTNDLCTLSVKDNGLGISESQKDNVFKMFSRNKTDVDGFGIGLSCALSIAERLNGDIYYKNNSEGQGVTFFVEWYYQKSFE